MIPVADHVQYNQALWNAQSAEYQRRHAQQLPTMEPTWGVWSWPESELQVLGEVAGCDVLELGCGGAQWSIALARRAARATGLDVSEAQLAFARSLVAGAGVPVRLVQGDAEALPFADTSFDVVFCDHGAMSYCDPSRIVPEVARVLRPGGRFAFNMVTPLLDMCFDDALGGPRPNLVRDYFGLDRIESDEGISFQRTYGGWIRLFLSHGLAIEGLLELQAPEGAQSTYRPEADQHWCRHFPYEHIWRLRKAP